jgi:dihydroorotate dehydrogenase
MACGGINDYASASACLNAGATAIQLGSLLLRDPDAIHSMRTQTRI